MSTAEQLIDKRLAALTARHKKEGRELVSEVLAEVGKPDHSTVPNLFHDDEPVAYGEAGRATHGWERAYLPENQPLWTEDERKVRTPAKDMETMQFIQALALGDQARIREIMDSPENRAYARADLATGTISSAGTGFGLVPVGFANQISLILRRASRLRQHLNVVQINEFAAKIPVQNAATIAAVHAEAGDMTSGVTEPTYTALTPEPFKVGAAVRVSNELMMDSPLALVSVVSQDIGTAIGVIEDLEILDGTNVTHALLQDATDAALNQLDGTDTMDDYVDKYFQLAQPARGRATWLLNEAAAAFITDLGLSAGDRQHAQEHNAAPVGQDQFGSLLGRPLLVFPTGATGITADEIVFGDLSAMTLAVLGGLRADVSKDDAFVTDQITIRVSERIDAVITQASRINHHQVA